MQLGPLARGEQPLRPSTVSGRKSPYSDTLSARRAASKMDGRIDSPQGEEHRNKATFYVIAAVVVLCAGLLFVLLYAAFGKPSADESAEVSPSVAQETSKSVETITIAMQSAEVMLSAQKTRA